jgi:hypothetical protein
MGRFVTMMATNVSRHAHKLPLLAPSGPDWETWTLVDDRYRHLEDGLNYRENRYSTDGPGQHNEHGTAEQQCECQLAPQRDVRAP